MRYLILFFLLCTCTSNLSAQWPLYDIGTTLDIAGVHVKQNGTILISGNTGLLKESSDCGNTWTDIAIPYFNDLGKIQFIDSSTAYMLGDDGDYAKTIDGGSTWSISTTPAPDNLEAMYFLNDSEGYMVGRDGAIVHTSNGGSTWTLQSSTSTQRLQGVFFTDNLHGIVSGRNETLLKTENGGLNWTSILTGVSGDLGSIFFNNLDNGFICAEGGLYHINADLSLIEFQSLDPDAEFQDIYFTDANVGWACTDVGTVFVTNNGGQSWLPIELDGLAFELSAIHGRSFNSAFTVGSIGKVNGLCTITNTYDNSSTQDLAIITLTEDQILIEFSDKGDLGLRDIRLYDLKGSLVLNSSKTGKENRLIRLDKPGQPGIYLLYINTNSAHLSTKLSLY